LDKAQLTESGNVTINYQNIIINPVFPPHADIKGLAKMEFSPTLEKIIEENIKQSLVAQKSVVASLPEKDVLQVVANNTATSMANYYDQWKNKK